MFERIKDWLYENRELAKPAIVVLAAIVLVSWFLHEPPPPQVGPAPVDAEKVVIFMHGYGAAADDLVSVAKAVHHSVPDVSFVLPAGEHRASSGRAWIPSFTEPTKEEWEAKHS